MHVCGSVHLCASTQTTFLSCVFFVCWDGHVYVGSFPYFEVYMYQMHFFIHGPPFLFRPRVFPRALSCGARRGAACTLGACFRSGWAPWRVPGRSKSLVLASNHGIAFRPAEPSKAMETPSHVFVSAQLLYLLQVPHQPSNVYTSTQPRYNSSHASSFSLCDNHEMIMRVCVCAIEPRILQQAVRPTVPGTRND